MRAVPVVANMVYTLAPFALVSQSNQGYNRGVEFISTVQSCRTKDVQTQSTPAAGATESTQCVPRRLARVLVNDALASENPERLEDLICKRQKGDHLARMMHDQIESCCDRSACGRTALALRQSLVNPASIVVGEFRGISSTLAIVCTCLMRPRSAVNCCCSITIRLLLAILAANVPKRCWHMPTTGLPLATMSLSTSARVLYVNAPRPLVNYRLVRWFPFLFLKTPSRSGRWISLHNYRPRKVCMV